MHIMNALSRLSAARPASACRSRTSSWPSVAGAETLRTPLNLQSLVDERRVVQLPDGTWALTPEGVDWLEQDRELSDR